MQDKDTAPPSTAQARQTVRLVTSDRQIVRLVASPLATGQAERDAAVKAAVEAERTRKPRRMSLDARLKAAERNKLPVEAILPDSTIQIGKAATAENILPFDAWERKRNAR